MLFKHKITPVYLIKNLSVVLGLVFIWRSLWYLLDWFDFHFLGGNHLWSAIGGVIVGFLLLYLPDKDLRNIERL